jgi:hypothetical protein
MDTDELKETHNALLATFERIRDEAATGLVLAQQGRYSDARVSYEEICDACYLLDDQLYDLGAQEAK